MEEVNLEESFGDADEQSDAQDLIPRQYTIDWTKVRHIDDIKRILETMAFTCEEGSVAHTMLEDICIPIDELELFQ